MLPPIPFDKIVEYFTDPHVLKTTHPQQLKEQLKDVLTLASFLLTKAPNKIKIMREMIREEEDQLRKKVWEAKVRDIWKFEGTNIKLARDLIGKSIKHNREQQYDDFIETTKAQEQIKLKFFESENLPEGVNWLNVYQKNQRCLFIENEKYRIIVGLIYEIKTEQYEWFVQNIQFKGINSPQINLRHYLYSKVIPRLKEKHQDRSEFHFLSYLYKFLQFINLIEYQKKLKSQLGFNQMNEEELIFMFQERKYKIEFEKVQMNSEPHFLIYSVEEGEEKRIGLKMVFKDRFLKGEVEYMGIKFQSENINKMPSSLQLMKMVKKLKQYISNFIKIDKKYPAFVQRYRQFCFFKYGSQYWSSNCLPIHLLKKNQATEDGLYISNEQVDPNLSILIKVQSDKIFTSQFVSRTFTRKLIAEVQENPEAIFMHLILINFLVHNNNTDSELNEYDIEKSQVVYKFSRKSYQEQKLRPILDRQESQHSFNNFLLQVRINFSFTNLKISCNRHRQGATPISDSYLPKSWIKYREERERKGRTNEILDIRMVCECIQYEKQHFLMERIYDKKLNDMNKTLFNLKLNQNHENLSDMIDEN